MCVGGRGGALLPYATPHSNNGSDSDVNNGDIDVKVCFGLFVAPVFSLQDLGKDLEQCLESVGNGVIEGNAAPRHFEHVLRMDKENFVNGLILNRVK